MKIKPEDYQYMLAAIKAVTADTDVAKVIGLIKADTRVKNVNMRLRWDLFAYAGLTPWSCNVLYKYVDDTHIDTALRSIMKELNITA